MRGVFTALVTPFDDSGRLDLAAFRAILKDQKQAGVAGVVPCGTTGESPTLTLEEKQTLIRTTLEEMKGSAVKVIAGTGTNNTAETIELSRWAAKSGVDAVLVVTPYYNKPSQKGLEAHYRAVADAVSCEVILYNVPGRTGVSLTPQTIASLASHPKIRTIKEATGNVAFASEIQDALVLVQSKMDILSGDDATYLALLAVGGTGIISVASNLFPRAMVALQNHMEAGRFSEAREIHATFFPLFRDLFIESNPVPIKAAMEEVGFCSTRVRAPLAELSNESLVRLRASLKRCGISKGARL